MPKLEFTVVEGEVREEATLVFESDVVVSEPKKPKRTPPKPNPETEKRSEFTFPEKFTVNPKYNTEPILECDTSGVKTTYVPRFTEVSENYRVSDTVRERQIKKQIPDKKSQEKVTVDVDPTAELDENVEITDATVVTLGSETPDEPTEIRSTVFKFDTATVKESVPVETLEEEISFEPEQIEIPELKVEKEHNYTIPDPDENPALAVIEKKKVAIVEKAPEHVGDKPETSSKRGAEYTSHAERETFKDRFLDSIVSIRVRLIASAVIALLLLVLENLWILGIDVPKLLSLSSVPGIMAILDGQAAICLFVLAIPEVSLAFKRLFKKRFVPEIFLPVGLFALVAYYVTAVIVAPDKYPLFGLLFAMQTIGAILAALYRKKADFEGFKMISQSGEKKIVDRKLTRMLTEENVAVDGKVESHKSKTARVFRTNFVSDFMKRSAKCAENSTNVIIILGISLGAAVVTGAVAFFVLDGIISAMIAFAAVVMLSVPVISVLSHKVPYFYMQKTALSESGAVVGEATLYDYAGVDVITFHDIEVFGEEDINLQRIMLYGRSENLTKALYQMSALFSVVDGPLASVFADSLDRRAYPATDVRIDDGGVVGNVEGVEVRAGTLEYMVRSGINIPEDTSVESVPHATTKIMYAAEGGEVYAKFYIRYTLSEEFTMIMPVLSDEGIVPLIYTRDPNITTDLLRSLTAGSDSIRVLKKYDLPSGEEEVYAKVSAGLVTTGDKTNVMNMILLAKKYSRFQSRIAITEITSLTVGAVLSFILTVAGMITVPSLVLALWQIAWCGVLFVLSRRTLGLSDDKLDRRD